MTRRLELGLFWLVIATLLITHMLGFGQGDRPLWFGWMPVDLGYRLIWILAAAAAVFWMTGRLWPDED